MLLLVAEQMLSDVKQPPAIMLEMILKINEAQAQEDTHTQNRLAVQQRSEVRCLSMALFPPHRLVGVNHRHK